MDVRAQSQQTNALSVTAKPGDWRYLNSDPQATRYSPLDEINKDNFKDLKIAWRWNRRSAPRLPPSEEPRKATETRRSQSIGAKRPRS